MRKLLFGLLTLASASVYANIVQHGSYNYVVNPETGKTTVIDLERSGSVEVLSGSIVRHGSYKYIVDSKTGKSTVIDLERSGSVEVFE